MAQLKKNTASQVVFFGLINASTGAALTGATVTVYVCKDGTQTTAAGTVTETAHGGYSFAPTQADTNGTNIGYIYTATSAIPVFQNYLTDVVDANGYASVNLADILGTAVSTPATAGILDINVKNINNVSASAVTTVKAVQGLTTADTIATYTGNTVQTGDAYARLGAPAGASTAADIAAISAKTTNLPASPASTTNITAGTITTVTNLTNAPTAGDLTATMKASVTTSATAATPTIAGYTGNTPQTGDAYAAVNALSIPSAPTIANSVLTTAMAEAYPTQGATFSLAKGIYQLVQQAGQMSISGTTETVKKRDGSTTAKTFTLDSATAPTTISETT